MNQSTNQPTEQATAIQPTVSNPTPQPVSRARRPMSSVERDLPPWLKAAMNGKSNNGKLSGRGY